MRLFTTNVVAIRAHQSLAQTIIQRASEMYHQKSAFEYKSVKI